VQILSTKLSIPPPRSRLVLRPRLIQKLNQGMECGFALISAPAGYGKTTLLSAWLSKADCASTWLSLDDSDNDPARFLAYLEAAIRVIDPSIENEIDSLFGFSTQPEIETFLTPLINHLYHLSHPFCLVLDDYHIIQNQVVHQAVEYLIEHRPPGLQLIIVTRADPPLPLARYRARSSMMELRLTDLRFSMEETADFLNHTMGLKVTPEDVARITKRTEGWIAGLQMAALSMQNTDDIPGFITNLTGTHHYIFDYLIEEILAQQSPEIHRFLIFTSILDQLTASLCDALLDSEAESSHARQSSFILEALEHANLFIIPLDHEQRWYRYHPLFSELLRGYLQQNNPDLIPILHNRASIWLEKNGLIPEAIRHLFLAGDWEGVIRLVSANIFALLEQNELNNVARQLDILTKEKTIARPWLLMGRAWLAAYTGQLDSVEPILKMAESEICNLNSEIELQKLGGHIAAIRAYTNWIGDRRDIAASAARAALEWLPENEYLIRCQAATLLGLVLRDFNDREQALKQALGYAREISVSHVTIFAHGCWAWMLAMQGKLREAYAACLHAIQIAQSSSSPQALPTLSHVYTTLSFLLCEWNDLEGALFYSKEAVNLASKWEQADAIHFALDNLGNALFASGDEHGAFDVLHQAWQVARRTSTWFEEITLCQEVEWYLTQENLQAALECLRKAQINIDEVHRMPISSSKSQLLPFTYINIFIIQKQYSKALTMVELLLGEMRNKRIGYYYVRALTLQALAYQGMKQEKQALASLENALTLAAPEGYTRTFLSKKPGLFTLLRQARAAGIMPEYIDGLLVIYQQGLKDQPIKVVTTSKLVEPLSEREMDVLKLLAQGYTDKKIAETLVIARETVRELDLL
jgi:LuxR family maltose regulon positive regulatory protein